MNFCSGRIYQLCNKSSTIEYVKIILKYILCCIFPICLCQRAAQYNVFFRILSELVFGLRYTITKNMSSDRFASVHIIFCGDILVHKLPYGPQCHELFVKYCTCWKNSPSIIPSMLISILDSRSIFFSRSANI